MSLPPPSTEPRKQISLWLWVPALLWAAGVVVVGAIMMFDSEVAICTTSTETTSGTVTGGQVSGPATKKTTDCGGFDATDLALLLLPSLVLLSPVMQRRPFASIPILGSGSGTWESPSKEPAPVLMIRASDLQALAGDLTTLPPPTR
jgi:hypothetical protein